MTRHGCMSGAILLLLLLLILPASASGNVRYVYNGFWDGTAGAGAFDNPLGLTVWLDDTVY
ncbi:MAG TPA: hypothetical protein EYH31_13925, partial [Anaerolineae bacterium]|nr:hypothetical protein [Anaerolineae bacterium]